MIRAMERISRRTFVESLGTTAAAGWMMPSLPGISRGAAAIYAELEDPLAAARWNAQGLAAALDAGFPDPEVENNARINLGDNFKSLGMLDAAEEQYRTVERVVATRR